MKKALFVLMASGMFLGLVGCKKDYTCDCSVNYGSSIDSTFSFTYEGVKKSKAEEGCEAAETTYKLVDPNASCALK